MVTDILDTIDAVTAPVCGWCSKTLCPDGPHQDFCGDVCQVNWARGAAGVPPASDGVVGILGMMPDTPIQSEAFADLAAAMRSIAFAVGRVVAEWRGLLAAVNQAIIDAAQLADVIFIEKPLPTDPMARALELRRRRNTGPTVSRRPPKRIDATRGRPIT
jgi:hypothetical protein